LQGARLIRDLARAAWEKAVRDIRCRAVVIAGGGQLGKRLPFVAR
jgi:hypothetical protein